MESSGSLIGKRGLLRMHEGMIPFLKAIRVRKRAHWKVLYLVQLLVVRRTGSRFDLLCGLASSTSPKLIHEDFCEPPLPPLSPPPPPRPLGAPRNDIVKMLVMKAAVWSL